MKLSNVIAMFLVLSLMAPAYGQKSSSKPPSSSSKPPSSSSKPPSSSKPSFSSPNTESKPSAPKPKFSSPNTETKPTQPAKPKFSSPNTETKPVEKSPPTQNPKPKFSSPNTESKPIASDSPKSTNPNKPAASSAPQKNVPPAASGQKPERPTNPVGQTGDNASSKKPTSQTASTKANAAKEAQSQRIYEESKKATAPPKPAYKTPEGRTVNVRTDSAVVKTIRNNPSTYYNQPARQQRSETHIHHHHYSQPYDWYYSQPRVYVGGGYSSAFWWMMSEWSAERRAQWFYHNQNVIERDAYERGMRDAAVANRVAELKAQGARVDPDYVDPEFSQDPSLMYTQDHIEAVYNPKVSNNHALTIFLWIIIISFVLFSAYVLLFRVRWGS